MTPERIAETFLNDWFNSCDEWHSQLASQWLAAAIRQAIADERERCARIAESTGRQHPLFADEVLQKEIAARIREGEK